MNSDDSEGQFVPNCDPSSTSDNDGKSVSVTSETQWIVVEEWGETEQQLVDEYPVSTLEKKYRCPYARYHSGVT